MDIRKNKQGIRRTSEERNNNSNNQTTKATRTNKSWTECKHVFLCIVHFLQTGECVKSYTGHHHAVNCLEVGSTSVSSQTPCDHLEFYSAAIAQNDEFKGTFHSPSSRLLKRKMSLRNSIISVDTYWYVSSIHLAQRKLCIRKTEPAVKMKCHLDFTKLHGHGGERWPTEVTSNTYFTVWRVSGLALVSLSEQAHSMLQITEDGSRLFTGSNDQTVRSYNLKVN